MKKENLNKEGQSNITSQIIDKEYEKKNVQTTSKNDEPKSRIQEVTKMVNEEFKVKQDNVKNKPGKGAKIAIISTTILFILIMVASTIFALLNMNNNKIIKGISIRNIDVSGLTVSEAKEKVQEKYGVNLKKDILLKYNDYETTVTPEQIDAEFNVEEAVEQAYEIGRKENIIKNNYKIINTMMNEINIDLKFSYNDEFLNIIMDDISSKLPDKVEESSYYIEGKNLIITSGKEGKVADKDELKKLIIQKLDSGVSNTNEYIEIPVKPTYPQPIDVEKVHNEIYKEAQNAYYEKQPFKVYPHVDGVDFKISVDEAKEMLKEQKSEYVIPLKITTPEITTNQIGSEAFPDLLATFTTRYNAGNANRTQNVTLAANKIDGTVVLPGEEFSYNKTVGERTIAAGYKEAAVYSNGQVVDGIGGGICQVSSTLYNSVVLANLDIVSRRNHQFVTSYVPAGRDATVVYGSTDFKFKNTRKYPIRIKSYVKGGILKIDIFGIKEETEYEVVIDARVTASIPYTTQYVNDSSLARGKEVVKQKGSNGTKSETYKILKLNGQVVSRTLLSKDTYNPMHKIVRRGTR